MSSKVMKQVSSKLKQIAADNGIKIDIDEFERMLEEQLSASPLRKKPSTLSYKRGGAKGQRQDEGSSDSDNKSPSRQRGGTRDRISKRDSKNDN